ncbi:transposase, partial [Escherichia coli]|nr:transposase [Escherichia coli]
MKRLQAFKFQLRPGGQQERETAQAHAVSCSVCIRALRIKNKKHE